jgi:hypothetical protein
MFVLSCCKLSPWNHFCIILSKGHCGLKMKPPSAKRLYVVIFVQRKSISTYTALFKSKEYYAEIWGFHGGEDDDVLLGFSALYSPTFRINMLSPSSGRNVAIYRRVYTAPESRTSSSKEKNVSEVALATSSCKRKGYVCVVRCITPGDFKIETDTKSQMLCMPIVGLHYTSVINHKY